MSWYGGKAAVGRKIGPWINSLLPRDRDVTYIEPYAGMLGVLLGRPRSKTEIANDLNARVVNWWEVVRDRPDEFKYKLDHTPRSEQLFRDAIATMDDGTCVERAVKFHIVVMLGIAHGDGVPGGFAVVYMAAMPRAPHWFAKRIPALARRVAGVEMTCSPATDILARYADDANAVVYCDPPYRTADTSTYAVDQQDHDETVDLLKMQRGRVAISGYRDEWDELGWQRHELPVPVNVVRQNTQMIVQRTEVLWTNYQIGQELLL